MHQLKQKLISSLGLFSDGFQQGCQLIEIPRVAAAEYLYDLLVLHAFVELLFDVFFTELACSLVVDKFWKITICRHSNQLCSFMGPSSFDEFLGFFGI